MGFSLRSLVHAFSPAKPPPTDSAAPPTIAPTQDGAASGPAQAGDAAVLAAAAAQLEPSAAASPLAVSSTDGAPTLIRSDLDFLLAQIVQAESGAPLADPSLPFGLRTVSGVGNHVAPEQADYGSADRAFPRLTDPVFRDADDGTSYTQTAGTVFDAQPRIISNLIVEQDPLANPAAAAADPDGDGVIPNAGPNGSAPFNQWFTLFGQFFDHGLDLVNKGGSGTVFVPLQPDDPLYVEGGSTNFMVLERATNQPGPDGVLGTADDVREHINQTTPFVDQNQTYTSHPSHQVFLREYALDADGKPVATGKLLGGVDGGLATWADVKLQAREKLGIALTDADVTDVPLLATDEYGRFIRGPNGYAQIVTAGPDGIAGTADDALVEGDPLAPISTASAIRTGHAFLNDVAHDAVPTGKVEDGDLEIGLANLDGSDLTGAYDNELLNAHFVTGDGRGNENIGLTSVHHVFHAEHNRLVDYLKTQILAEAPTDPEFVGQWLLPGANVADGVQDTEWSGERLFQAARVVTEMQYQHLVFQEFARRIQPNIDAFEDHDITIDPAIVAEFAHTVYRFGHSMLRETVDRVDANGNVVDADPAAPGDQQMSLIEAFLNPLAYAERGVDGQAAGEIVRGATVQVGAEIDEFVTGALRSNLLGLPLDLAAINIARGRDAGVAPLNDVREQLFQATGDASLEPYTSWADFAENIRHPESLVNFVAAYGVHERLSSAATVAEKRAAAASIIFGTPDDPATAADESLAPDTDFLNGTGAYAGVETGINLVDFWIGGLAEKPWVAGGLLGSTFGLVFETQLESLQNGDRFYYVGRLEGTNLRTQIQSTSFAEMVMRNTGTSHLSFDVFSTPAHTIEAGDPSTHVDAAGDTLVAMRGGVLQYLGNEHIVLGGTAANDSLAGGGGDDTLYGDAGADRLDGRGGADNVIGGDGDDHLSGGDGDDFLKGAAGNDTLLGGVGADVLRGLEGEDVIDGGAGDDNVLGGGGNDRISGGAGVDMLVGNEGDDWLMGGAGDDTLIGDNGNPFTGPLADIDTAAFVGGAARYTITHNPDGTVTVADRGNGGVDTLVNIERLQFSDRTIALDAAAPQLAGAPLAADRLPIVGPGLPALPLEGELGSTPTAVGDVLV